MRLGVPLRFQLWAHNYWEVLAVIWLGSGPQVALSVAEKKHLTTH